MFFSPWHGNTWHPGFVHIVQPFACSGGFYPDQDGPRLSQNPGPLQATDCLLVLLHCQTPPHNDLEVNL